MQPIGVAQPLRRIRRRDQAAVAIGGDDVFGDRAGLRDGVAVVGDDGRFAERMNGAQFLRRAHVRLALIADDLVGHAEFFEQPQHALRAGIVEMMNRQHGVPRAVGAALSCQPGGKVEMAWWTVDIYPDILTAKFTRVNITCRIQEISDESQHPTPALPPSRATAAWHPARSPRSRLRSEWRPRRRPHAPIIIFNDATGRPIDLDLRGSDDDMLARLPQLPPDPPTAADETCRGGTARPRPAETRRGRARGHAAAAALGMARRATRRRLGRDTQAGRRGAPRQRRRATASAPRGTRPIISCRSWPATCRISRKRRGRCSPMTGRVSSASIAGWPDDIRDHVVKLAFSDRAGTVAAGDRAVTVDGHHDM